MQKRVTYDYHFKALNLSDFELTLDFKLEGKLAKYARTGIIKSIKMHTKKNVGKVDVWEAIPPNMYGFINLQAKQFINKIEVNELNPDGVKILHHRTTGGEYKDNLKEIYLKIKVSGLYKMEK